MRQENACLSPANCGPASFRFDWCENINGRREQLSTVNPDSPLLFPCALNHNFHIAFFAEALEFLAPLDDDKAARADEIVNAKRLQFTLGIDAVKVYVIDIGFRRAVLMDEGESRAGNFLLRGRLKPFNYPFN